MEVAIIILAAFVLLLFIVAVLLGNKYLKVKNRLKEVETAETKELSQSQVTKISDKEQFHLFDEEKMAIDIAIKALNHTIVDESDRGLAADLLTKLKQRLNDFII